MSLLDDPENVRKATEAVKLMRSHPEYSTPEAVRSLVDAAVARLAIRGGQIPMPPPMPKPPPMPLADWSRAHRIIDDNPFVIPPFLQGLYDDDSPDIVVKKAAQVMISEWAINTAMWVCDTRQGGRGNVLYLYPNKVKLEEFSHARVDKAIDESPYITDLLTGVNNVGLKRVGKGHFYLRGADRRASVITVDADCFDDQTEVLTERGWLPFAKVQDEDWIATLNSNGELEYQQPTKQIAYPWEGDLVCVESQQVNLAVKPGHNLYIRRQVPKGLPRHEFELMPAEQAYGMHIEFKKDAIWRGTMTDTFTLPAYPRRAREARELAMVPFLKFLGFFIAEGCADTDNSPYRTVVRLAQNEGTTFEWIKSVVEELGYSYKTYQRGKYCELRIRDPQLATWLADSCGLGSKNKRIPPELLKLDGSLLEHLYANMMLGDGCSNGFFYGTASPTLANQFQELCLKTGRCGKLSPAGRIVAINRSNLTPRVHKSNWSRKSYSGMVYCVSVPNRIIYVRRHGVAQWAGNCVVYDELDEMQPWVLSAGEKRLGSSLLGWQRKISTPTYQGIGIDAEWDRSDQRWYMIPCNHCGYMQPLVFDNLRFDTLEYECEHCHEAMSRHTSGEWVALKPDADRHGYYVSKLYNPRANLKLMVEASEATNETERQEFFNSDLGLAYAPRGTSLNASDIDACIDPEWNELYRLPEGKTYMGVDVGTLLHVTILHVPADGSRPMLVAAQTETWANLDRLMHQYQIHRCAIDAGPDIIEPKMFCQKFTGRSVRVTYKLDGAADYKEDDDCLVAVARTESMDEMYAAILDRKLRLPEDGHWMGGRPLSSDRWGPLYKHLMAPNRLLRVNSRGNTVAVYDEAGRPDHYAHSLNYAMIASHDEYFNKRWASMGFLSLGTGIEETRKEMLARMTAP